MNADETSTFMYRKDINKYDVKEITTINIEEIKWSLFGLVLMTLFMWGFIYYATN